MLSFNRNSRDLVFARARARVIALLATTAFLALSAIGCELDCSYQPSRCLFISLNTLCASDGGCTVDAQPASCTGAGCALAPAQKLTIPLDSLTLTGLTPDLLITFAGGSVLATDVHAVIDGKAVAVREDETVSPTFVVKWADATTVPKKLDLTFTGGTAAVQVELHFEQLGCRMAELSACHSGGA